MLSWKPPEDDGGKAVIGYGVEYQSVMDTADNWVHAAIVKEDTGWTGSNGFTGGMIYRFRVSAHNEKGIGEICHLETPIKFLCKFILTCQSIGSHPINHLRLIFT